MIHLKLHSTMKRFAIVLICMCNVFLVNGKCNMLTIVQKIYEFECDWKWRQVSRRCYFFFCKCTVLGDVSSLTGVKTFASTTSSSSPENSDSFSILTKEFLNRPDSTLGNRIAQRPPGNEAAAAARESENGVTDNNLPDSNESDDRQAYFYDKPKIPFEFESTNIHTNTVPPKK